MDAKGPGRWFYWVALVGFACQLLFFILDAVLSDPVGPGRGPVWLGLLIMASLLLFDALFLGVCFLIFLLRGYAVKHLVLSLAVFVFLLLFFLNLNGSQWGTSVKARSDALEAALYGFGIVYAALMLKGKVRGLNQTFPGPEPWRSLLILAVVGAAVQAYPLLTFAAQGFVTDFWTPSYQLARLMSVPGLVWHSLLGICPKPEGFYYAYGPSACDLLLVGLGNLLPWALIGLVVGLVKKRSKT